MASNSVTSLSTVSKGTSWGGRATAQVGNQICERGKAERV